MGKSLVDQIPTNSDDYQEWLKAQRAHWAKWDDLLQKILDIGPEDLAELRLPRAEIDTENIWHEAFDERLKSIPPSFHIGTYNFSVEWSYTIDLDREVFSVDNGAHFRLDRVSQNGRWIKALALDQGSQAFANRFTLSVHYQFKPFSAVQFRASGKPYSLVWRVYTTICTDSL